MTKQSTKQVMHMSREERLIQWSKIILGLVALLVLAFKL
jgi:hypothetical protein